jgi:hypothetical protein
MRAGKEPVMSETHSAKKYPFKGLALTPAVIRPLILELFRGKLVESRAILEAVSSHHFAKGGRKGNRKNISHAFMRALSNMSKAGLATKASYGY